MIAWFIHIAFAIAAMVFCAIAPNGYDQPLFYTIAACYCVQTILFFLTNGRKNFVGFAFFFCIAFFFVNFAYPLFYYPEQENWMFYWHTWNRGIITRNNRLKSRLPGVYNVIRGSHIGGGTGHIPNHQPGITTYTLPTWRERKWTAAPRFVRPEQFSAPS